MSAIWVLWILLKATTTRAKICNEILTLNFNFYSDNSTHKSKILSFIESFFKGFNLKPLKEHPLNILLYTSVRF